MNYAVLDMRGIPCPEPLIKTVKAIDSSHEKNLLKVLTDKDECVKLIKDTVEGFSLGTVEVASEGSYYVLLISVKSL